MTIRKRTRGQTIIYVSETVNLRRTDNTKTIRKKTRGQTIIDKTLHRKVYQNLRRTNKRTNNNLQTLHRKVYQKPSI